MPVQGLSKALRRLAGGLVILAGSAAAEGIPGPTLESVLEITGFWLQEDYDRREALLPLVESEGIGALYLSDRLVHLDAEALAEGGMFDTLLKIGPHLRMRGVSIRSMSVIEETPGYVIEVNGIRYEVYSKREADRSWELATETFVRLVNDLLSSEGRDRFYALNSGNDLSGFFLPPEVLPFFIAGDVQVSDRPYTPTRKGPDYGMPADG